jgi:molybdopterin converting factor small subunit
MLTWIKGKTQSWHRNPKSEPAVRINLMGDLPVDIGQRGAKKTRNKSMLSIRVKFMGDLPAVTGQRQIEVELPKGSNLGDLLAWLSNTYGEAFVSRVFSGPAKLEHTVLLFVDGENVKGPESFDVKLGDSEVDVVMLPMFGGG